jgi:hypothetical protein
MTSAIFEQARARGTEDKVGQLNPMGRYGIPEGTPRLLYLELSYGINAHTLRMQRLRTLPCFWPRVRQPFPLLTSRSCYLADDSSYINGQAFVLDGGITASIPVIPPKAPKAP